MQLTNHPLIKKVYLFVTKSYSNTKLLNYANQYHKSTFNLYSAEEVTKSNCYTKQTIESSVEILEKNKDKSD